MTETVAPMTDQDVIDWHKKIRKAAYSVQADYPGLEIDDIIMATWEALLGMQAKGKLLTPWDENVFTSLRYAAQKYAHKERQLQLTISPQYAYRTSDIRNLFESFFDKETWMNAEVPEDAKDYVTTVRVGGVSSDGGVLYRTVDISDPIQLELMSDLSRAWDRLSIQYKQILFRMFALPDMHAWGSDNFARKDRYALANALTRVRDILNTHQPKSKHIGPGARKVMTNAAARYTIGTLND